MSTPDSSWRWPVGPRNAADKKAEAERLGSLSTRLESVRIAGTTTGTRKSLVYLVLLAAVVAVIILAIVLS